MKIVRSMIQGMGAAWSYICPMSVCERMEILQKVVYSSYLKRFFRSMGSDSFLEYKAASLVGLKYISIGSGCLLGKGIRLTAWDNYYGQPLTPNITIGDGCNIGSGAHITACNSIVIGNNVLTGPDVLISDNSHGRADMDDMMLPPVERPLVSKGEVRIEDNVWIGRCASIMPGVTIGRNSIIGANSVVTRDIPPFSVAAGIPARVIKTIEQ